LSIATENNTILGPLETDPETGLPKLPEGLAWRVSRSSAEGNVKVSVVTLPDTTPFFPDIYTFSDASSDSLKVSAIRVYENIRLSQESIAQVESVIGLYPPNSL
jgi:hypothetical protein